MKKTPKTRSIQRTVLALLLTLFVMAAAAIAPAALLSVEDTALLAEPQQRAETGGGLSGNSYLSWMLHSRAEAMVPLGFVQNPEEWEQQADKSYVAEVMLGSLRTMEGQGVLSSELVNCIAEYLYRDGEWEAFIHTDDFGFQQLQITGSTKDDTSCYMWMNIEMRTGAVVMCTVYLYTESTAYEGIEYDPAQMLKNYVNWLGFGPVEDWEYKQEENILMEESGTVYARGSITSATAQLRAETSINYESGFNFEFYINSNTSGG